MRPGAGNVARRQWGDVAATTVAVAGGVHLWPCSDRLADLTLQLASSPDGDRRLAQLLAKVSDHYDFALIDSPPGIGFLSGLALVTARWVPIPIEPADLLRGRAQPSGCI
jgi:chromosome partitioning protein